MLDALALHPGERARGPELRPLVAAGVDEGQELLVGDVVHVDLEGRYVDDGARELVVPAEADLTREGAERRAAGRDHHARRCRRRSGDVCASADGRSLVVAGELMPHVEHRLLVHRLVLEDRVDGLGLVEQRMPGLLERGMCERIEHEGIARIGKVLDLIPRRPFGPPAAAGVRLVLGIDAAREQALERVVDTRTSEPFLHQRVDAEGRQVPLVEDDRVAQRDRPREVGLRLDEIEQLSGSLPDSAIPVGERRAVQGRSCCGHELLDVPMWMKVGHHAGGQRPSARRRATIWPT